MRNDGPPWNCWMAVLEILREPAGGIREALPPDYAVLKQAFGKKGFSASATSGVLGKQIEALSDEAQQLIVGAHRTCASRKRCV